MRRNQFKGIALLASMLVGENVAFELQVSQSNVKRLADGLLTLTAFTILPDVTTSSLSISDNQSNDPGLSQTTLGGGFTVSQDIPLSLEGNLGWSRFDPEFVVSDGTESRRVPVKRNSLSATGGIGWDFPLDSDAEWKLRPVFNFVLGRTTTDAAILGQLAPGDLGDSLEIINDTKMDSYGLGGSLLLDFERYRDTHEIDIEIRYTNIHLRTFNSTDTGLEDNAANQTLGVWSRWRAPTGLTVMQRALRYVLEASHTRFFCDQRGALGFDRLTSLGTGIEFDSSAYTSIITRTRPVGRYVFGDSVRGFSIGVAMSF